MSSTRSSTQQKLERQLFTDPFVVTELLERYYREQGYLAAEIDEPRYEFNAAVARVVIAVREGPAFTVRRVSVSGNELYTNDVILSQLPLVAGEPFLPAAAERSLDKIRDLYWAKGYNDVRSDYRLVLDRSCRPGRSGVHDHGRAAERDCRHRRSRAIRRPAIAWCVSRFSCPNQSRSISALLARSRRNLYETGAFSLVSITPEPVENDSPDVAGSGPATPDDPAAAPPRQPADAAPSPDAQSDQNLVRVNVSVREVQPIQMRYGASYDTERGVGGIFDISSHNLLGGARVVGLRARYDGQLKEGRIYINQPALRYFPFKTTASVYFREDLSPPTEITRAFTASRKGASIEQEVELRDAYVWSWGYRYEHARTLEPVAGVLIGQAQTVSPLTTTLTRETRDEPLDASRGAFLSQSIAFSPGWLGSDMPYLEVPRPVLPLLPASGAAAEAVDE